MAAKLTKEEFIEKSIKIHKNKYDYSLVEYKNVYDKIKIICPTHGIFEQLPCNHLSKHGCPSCTKSSISKSETQWLNFLNVLSEHRQKIVKINNNDYKVDAYNPNTNTIYEFLGDYWHGNPNKYILNEINKHCKKSFGELYQKTLDRIQLFEKNGYKIVYIWESDFKKRFIIKQEF